MTADHCRARQESSTSAFDVGKSTGWTPYLPSLPVHLCPVLSCPAPPVGLVRQEGPSAAPTTALQQRSSAVRATRRSVRSSTGESYRTRDPAQSTSCCDLLTACVFLPGKAFSKALEVTPDMAFHVIQVPELPKVFAPLPTPMSHVFVSPAFRSLRRDVPS